MILPTYEVKDLIESLKIADAVFTTSIDEEYQKDVQSTVILIAETVNDLDKRANNRFRNMNYGVEVQIFYGTDFNQPILDVEIKLARLLEKNDWVITQSKSHINDPKTDQVTKVFYFEKNYLLED
ncbi:prophage pi3 protein 18 [Leuconostoc kimchii IMSNU 11154]|uniref:Prophage pi3 protein 18 n=2 Tax=Leuconostoc kimchii TaxID=136609 RepID=D5T0U7_LEUKI|nr:prophage pi3 protein 18 [Leuconostoc kimchii IMSNU 11154]